jgi:hypothetical protein
MASAGGLGAARHNPDLPECNRGFLSRAIKSTPLNSNQYDLQKSVINNIKINPV